jgi:hypothetical protein
MKGIIFSVCVMMVGVFSWGTIAVASPGPFYNIGENAGEMLAENAWNNLGKSCQNLRTFTEIVRDGIQDAARDIELRIYGGHSARDFSDGYQAGLWRVLKQVRYQCRQTRNANSLLDRLEELVRSLFNRVLAGGRVYQPAPEPPVTEPDAPTYYRPSPGGSHYNIAKNAARGLAESTWGSLGWDCTRTSDFVKIVGYGVDDAIADIGTRYTGWAAEEFGRGYIDGLVEVLDRVVNLCVNECSMLGNAMGEWSAKMFCRVAEVIGRTPRFTSRVVNIRGRICGNAYSSGCESNFVGIARGMCPRYTGSDAFRLYYRAANDGCCSYNPY